ncbi:hypothetical protein FRC11_010965, partial [Ceratobasidium sp. 423]
MPDFNHRSLFQLVNPNNDAKLVELHVDFDATLQSFWDSNNLGHGIFYLDSLLPSTYAVPTGQANAEPIYPQVEALDIQSHLPLIAGSITIPGAPLLDNDLSYHTNLQVQISAPPKSDEQTFASLQYSGTSRTPGPSSDKAGTVVMNVPELGQTPEEVMQFVKGFVKGLNKG